MDIGNVSADESVRLCAGLSARLRSARESRGLTRRALAAQADLAPGTVNSLEAADRNVGVATVERLATVMDVSPAWLAYGAQPVRRVFNYHVAPGFDPLGYLRHVDAVVRGVGGRLDPSMLYIDPFSAVQYAALTEGAKQLPLEAASRFISGIEPWSVIALGSGMARHETRLVELISRQTRRYEDDFSIYLFLVEISHTLLVGGYTHAMERLQGNVPVTAIEGDFEGLPSFMHYFAPQGPRRKLVTMLGFTIGNLPSEIDFLRESLVGCTSGDLLLVDFGLRQGSIKEEAAASLARAKPHVSFLTKPLSRVYGEDNITIESKIASRCPIPSSYALEIYATVKDRRFMVASWRRYDAKSLFDAFGSIGWHHVGSWTFDDEKPNCLALFKRS